MKKFALLAFFFLFTSLFNFPEVIYAQGDTFQQAKVSLTFDDGFASTYTYALPILSQRNITATEFLTINFVNNGITEDGLPAMTWAQAKELQDQYGWEVGSHTVTHAELPTISTSQIHAELYNSKSTLESKGFSVTSLASPYGAYNNATLIDALKIYNLHRGFWDRDDQNVFAYDRSIIQVQSIETGVNFATVKSWIDQAISQKKWLVLVFHEVKPSLNPNYEYTTTTQELTQIADYIKQSGIQVVRMDHTLQKPGANLLSNSTFANGIAGGWSTDTSTKVLADTANNGSYPASIEAIKLLGSSTTAHLTSPSVMVNPGATYSLQAFVNANGLTSGSLGFSIDEYSASNTLLSTKSLGNVAVKTVKYFSNMYTPSAAVASFRIQTTLPANAVGTVYVDNYELYSSSTATPLPTPSPTPFPSVTPTATPNSTMTPTPTATASPSPSPTLLPTATPSPAPTPTPIAGANLISNPSFETASGTFVSNWTRFGTTFSLDTTSKGSDGTNSIHLVANSGDAYFYSSNVPVVSTNTYTWTTHLKMSKAKGTFGFYVDEYNSNGGWISGQDKGTLTTLFTGVKTFSYKPSSSRVRFASLQYYAEPKSAFDLYIDSVSLIKK